MLTRIITGKPSSHATSAALNRVKPSFSAQQEFIPSQALTALSAPPVPESESLLQYLLDLPRYVIHGPTEKQKAVKALKAAAREKEELIQALNQLFQRMKLFDSMRKRPIAKEVVANLHFIGETIERATITPKRELIILSQTDDEKYVLYYGKLNSHQKYEFTKYSEFNDYEVLDTKENLTFIQGNLTVVFPKSKEYPIVNGETTRGHYNPVYGRSPIGGSIL